jgi:hypothetical protein
LKELKCCAGICKNIEIIYKTVVNGTKREENDKYAVRAKNKTEAMWFVINK